MSKTNHQKAQEAKALKRKKAGKSKSKLNRKKDDN